MKTTLTRQFAKSLMTGFGPRPSQSRSEKIGQMANLIEEGLQQVGLLFGKDDMHGAVEKINQLADLYEDAVDLAETTGVKITEPKAQVREIKRSAPEVKRMLLKGDTADARKMLAQQWKTIEASVNPLRRTAAIIKD